METIITLLIVLLPAIFKVIEKKINESSEKGASRTPAVKPEVFDNDVVLEEATEEAVFTEEDNPWVPRPAVVELPSWTAEANFMDYADTKPSMEGRSTLKPKPSVVKPAVKRMPQNVVADEDQGRREPIDPKKLVIYSEIMKTKF